MGKLDGQVALVTGGARGQGRSHAVALAKEGADLVVCDIASQVAEIPYPLASVDELNETVKMVEDEGVRAVGLVADLRDTVAVASVVNRTIEEFGRVDILLANHGVVAYSQFEATSDELWGAVVDTNLTSVFKVLREVIPHMKTQRYGRIVATSSLAGRVGHANLPHYVSSKWGVIGLIKACAREVADWGITANVVCPSAVSTPLFLNQPTYDIFCPDVEEPTREDLEKRLVDIGHSLNGRGYLEPEHITRAIMYLVTDKDGVVSGQAMDIGLGASALSLA